MIDGHLGTNGPPSGCVRLELVNAQREEQTLLVEPWTTEYALAPGQIYQIISEGDTSLPIRIELTSEGITVCALDAEGATVSVRQNDSELRPKDSR